MKRMVLIAIAALLLFCGCTPSGDVAQYIERPRPEHTLPMLNGSETAYLGFSENLFRTVSETGEENPILSPASAYFALAMIANGADGETKAAFEEVLGLPIHQLNEVCFALMNNLSMTEGSSKLKLANSLWVDKDVDFSVSEEFVSLLQKTYFAEYTETDLQTAKQAVNAWVDHHTEGMIPEMLSDQPQENTRLLLINTLYLNTAWEEEFDPNSTRDRDFTREDGKVVTSEFLYAPAADRQCILTPEVTGVLLPYDDGKTAFLALKPNEGTVRELIAGFDGQALSGYLAAAEERFAWLTMPKFTKEYSIEMQDVLTQMGLGIAFDPYSADFSGAAPELFISRVLQKTRIDVHEKGTEAAAATLVEAADGAAMLEEEPVELCFDSPYLYAVVDLESRLPLFFGIMDDPA
ncbi:MAG: serpin family protein [Clostridia bacterium]|nr:serpin family protein [Clostridia bacterium]